MNSLSSAKGAFSFFKMGVRSRRLLKANIIAGLQQLIFACVQKKQEAWKNFYILSAFTDSILHKVLLQSKISHSQIQAPIYFRDRMARCLWLRKLECLPCILLCYKTEMLLVFSLLVVLKLWFWENMYIPSTDKVII